MSGVPWGLGKSSYWWPNKPFREAYSAQLHALSLVVSKSAQATAPAAAASATRRFGFVQWSEAANGASLGL